jgi:hypothetical protein
VYVRGHAEAPVEIRQLGDLLGKVLRLRLGASFVSRRFVPICPKKSPKMGVEFPLQLCKKEVLKILGALPLCKLNVRKG